jgi:hypothetical protein
MHKNATKCNETQGKWCKNKHGASKIIATFETYQVTPTLNPDTSPIDASDDDDDDVNEAFLNEMGIVYASLRGNNDAHAKVEHLMETLFEHKKTIKELNSLVNEGKWRFNLLK